MDIGNFTKKVYEKFQTRDVLEIAEKSGISIIYQKWHPVTVGEFDWRTKTICVNQNAEISSEKIIAHELGHYFLREFEVRGVLNEEGFCDDFADALLKTNLHAEAQRTLRANGKIRNFKSEIPNLFGC